MMKTLNYRLQIFMTLNLDCGLHTQSLVDHSFGSIRIKLDDMA